MEERHDVDQGKYTNLTECPVGMVLRETPYVYDAIGAASYVESGGVNPRDESAWFSRAATVIASERMRHYHAKRERDDGRRQSANDATYGRRMRARG